MIKREKVMEREGGNETLKQICLEDKPPKRTRAADIQRKCEENWQKKDWKACKQRPDKIRERSWKG
jgi:hypothetical protein